MIPKECKRLAEVDFPIASVSKFAVQEKKIFGHHPQMLNQWWARRPLASSRAILLALLWPDPQDALCPETFKLKARELLPQVQGTVGPTDQDLRTALLKFIADFANWDLAENRSFIETGRALVRAAHGEHVPVVADSFSGGGSIPLEALRTGCEALASDLNPVACLILKALLEDIPRHGTRLAAELDVAAAQIKERVEANLAEFYPKDPNGYKPLVYLWARTVRCESPNCGAEIPLVRSFWLCKKKGRKRALRYRVVRPAGIPPHVEFEVFEPRVETDVPGGTVNRAKATCLCCGSRAQPTVLHPERVRAQLVTQSGGGDVLFDAKGRRIGGALMLGVVTALRGEQGRNYRAATERDYVAVRKARVRLDQILDSWEKNGRHGLCPVPNEELPLMSGTFNVPIYGMARWGDLFTARQKIQLMEVIDAISKQPPALRELLAFVVTRMADKNASLVSWDPGRETIDHVFKRQALGMVWDFVESAIPSGAPHILDSALSILIGVVSGLAPIFTVAGQVNLADAAEHPLPDQAASLWFTDPPYYFAVPYADLSDFFFVWLKRLLVGHPLVTDPFDSNNALTPKDRELCEMAHWDRKRYAHKDKAFFEEGMRRAFAEGRRVLREDGVGCVVFAHKTTEGWEALLSGMIRGGWTITGSWPIATERPGRMRARESAALATSVHLVCRPRPEDAEVGDWGNVLRELPLRVGNWMERLQEEGVRGADLVFACIGPALEIFSRYEKVEMADGREVALAEYLEKVWEVVGRSALAQVLGTADARARNGAAGAVEEDARLTALFLWTLQSTNDEAGESESDEIEDDESSDNDEEEPGSSQGKKKGFTLVFDVVRRFAQPLGIELPKWEGRVIETKKGVVRLLPIAERAQQLFGEDGAQAVAMRLERATVGTNPLQGMLFPDMQPGVAKIPRRGRAARKHGRVEMSDENLAAANEATTLDRVHAAMLLQAGGRTNALRALLKAEQERGPDFLRLANALSALYLKGSEEKRLLDAMLLAVPR